MPAVSSPAGARVLGSVLFRSSGPFSEGRMSMTVDECNIEIDNIKKTRRNLYDRLLEIEQELDYIQDTLEMTDNELAFYEERRARILEQGEDDEQ